MPRTTTRCWERRAPIRPIAATSTPEVRRAVHSDAILSPYRAVLGSCGTWRARSTGAYCLASHPRAPLREKSALAGQAT
ncbi:hypothetical protein SEA_PULCHRA_56 [Microbacterium phage Pulchra]|uniref:Uncharacterized protein n=2 Tax=Quhwahvirus TaxID=2733202 RepID=A0A8A5LPH7_9CAUD|nr:hypothetical protein SEA_PULCHRA_56 [Microbacterium phage Pulchra]WNM67795.1 hypothetical protein SEA_LITTLEFORTUNE_56 [Microbacterium phage LittleFortune]